MDITVDELRQHIQPEDYDAVTGGDDTAAETFLENGRDRVKAVLTGYGVEYDESDTVIRLAVIKAALSELYSYSADWVTAESYRDEAASVLKPLAPAVYPEVASAAGSESWKGFD
ncbi:hypothetical protein EP073_12035 [Geovibrio thiophilus]|uniref:Phage gp6-like head-tail connector protein n=1 Tax=Geovibrio thiophilus TaxID=139438 RepID=A0A410K0Y4_9BACT|nr:hypothetical protein [Geovibrio thiophilus]QAR34106.1 hypothetical protein EP073_12035 [Geovibrio thiophilus]